MSLRFAALRPTAVRLFLMSAYPPLRLRIRSPQGGLTSRRASGARSIVALKNSLDW